MSFFMVTPFLVDGSDGGPPPHGPLSSVVFREFEHVLDISLTSSMIKRFTKNANQTNPRVSYTPGSAKPPTVKTSANTRKRL